MLLKSKLDHSWSGHRAAWSVYFANVLQSWKDCMSERDPPPPVGVTTGGRAEISAFQVRKAAYLSFRCDQQHITSAAFHIFDKKFKLQEDVSIWRHVCIIQIPQLEDALTVFPLETAFTLPLGQRQTCFFTSCLHRQAAALCTLLFKYLHMW